MADLLMNNTELLMFVRVGRRNSDNFKLSDKLDKQFDSLKQKVYAEWKVYAKDDDSMVNGVIDRIAQMYDIDYADAEWLIQEAIREDVPLSPEIVGIIQRAKRMGGEADKIAYLVDKPLHKVEEVLDNMPECDCPACQLRRKIASGNATTEDMIEFLKALKQHMEESGDDE